jgi:predicted GH43/DUF377 family glycosyl hydrolase
MAVNNVNYNDTLREGTDKINQSIDQSNQAIVKANDADTKADNAVQTANQANTKSDDTQQQLNNIVINNGESDAEVLQARGTYSVLNERLQATDEQLAETEQKIPNVANAKTTLKITNPYENYQNIHPKVLYFDNGWNGYKWWMAYTPYPNGDTKKENPCIAVSNDGLNWGVPSSFANNVLDDWNGVAGAYNNDTHLVFRSDLNRLEVWWRFVDTSVTPKVANLKRRVSTDGISWGATEVMFVGEAEVNDHISPSIVFEDSLYKMISVQKNDGVNWAMNYTDSSDGLTWTNRLPLSVNLNSLTPWHLDFIKNGNSYEMILQAWDIGGTNNTSSLYFLDSSDLINWSDPIKVLSPSPIIGKFDDAGIYRSSIVYLNGYYYVFYSAVDSSNRRSLAVSYSESITSLNGIEPDIEQITKNDSIINTMDVRQKTNPEKYGGLKVGNMLFANGLTDGVEPQDGSVRFNPDRKQHQAYSGSSWKPLSIQPLVFAEKNTTQNLINNSFVNMDFSRVVRNDGNFSNGVYTIDAPAEYKITFGLHFQGLLDGDEIEINLRKFSNNALLKAIIKEKLRVPSDGIIHVTGTAFGSFVLGDDLVISVKYTGTATSPKTTSYTSQNYLLIERF